MPTTNEWIEHYRKNPKDFEALLKFTESEISKRDTRIAALKAVAEAAEKFVEAFETVFTEPLHKPGEGMTVPYTVSDIALRTKMIDWLSLSKAYKALK